MISFIQDQKLRHMPVFLIDRLGKKQECQTGNSAARTLSLLKLTAAGRGTCSIVLGTTPWFEIQTLFVEKITDQFLPKRCHKKRFEYETVIESTQPPPKESNSNGLLHSCLGKTDYVLYRAFQAPSFEGGCELPITVP